MSRTVLSRLYAAGAASTCSRESVSLWRNTQNVERIRCHSSISMSRSMHRREVTANVRIRSTQNGHGLGLSSHPVLRRQHYCYCASRTKPTFGAVIEPACVRIYEATRQRYSTSAIRKDNDKVSPKGSTSSSSALDSVTDQATKWWNQGMNVSSQIFSESTKMAEKGVSRAAETASSLANKTLDETQKLTSVAVSESQKLAQHAVDETSKLASASYEAGQKALDRTVQEATKQVGETASNVWKHASDSATKLGTTASETVKDTTMSVGRVAHSTVSNVVEHNVNRPLKETSTKIKETSNEIVDSITSSGTKLLRWFALWSLAAIAVYGLVTTLPIALIKYAMERRKGGDNNDHDNTSNNKNSSTNKDLEAVSAGAINTTSTSSSADGHNIWTYIRNFISPSSKEE